MRQSHTKIREKSKLGVTILKTSCQSSLKKYIEKNKLKFTLLQQNNSCKNRVFFFLTRVRRNFDVILKGLKIIQQSKQNLKSVKLKMDGF